MYFIVRNVLLKSYFYKNKHSLFLVDVWKRFCLMGYVSKVSVTYKNALIGAFRIFHSVEKFSD